jgi:predicted lipoprotein with Yx(FWY)xxD motif
MRRLRDRFKVLLSATLLAAVSTANAQPVDYWQTKASTDREDYVHVPMPPGIQVIDTEFDGPVFADANGRTLYSWPLKNLRNGDTGDRKKGLSVCEDQVFKETSGLMSPYPPGFLLPELDKRPSCVQVWPPLIAAADAKPVGKWTLVPRKDGSKQWAYDDFPVYTSSRDRRPGDVLGGTKTEKLGVGGGGGTGVLRVPIGPPPDIPPELAMVPVATGHLLVDHKSYSVYTWDGDGPGKSNCDAKCLEEWSPVLAPEGAQQQGQWTTVERSPGIKQWAFRKKPLYTYILDPRTRSLVGSDVPGWHNVYTQRALPPPKEFTVQDSRIGQVLADSRGMTIYIYRCTDDALDQLACDNPDTPQAYRLAICGNGDPKVCNETFPYLTAAPNARSESRFWSVMAIDPNTGHRAAAGQADAVHVWAYRERPVYTSTRDRKPGDANGDGFGEFNGYRDGFKAFWLRDDFLDNATGR